MSVSNEVNIVCTGTEHDLISSLYQWLLSELVALQSPGSCCARSLGAGVYLKLQRTVPSSGIALVFALLLSDLVLGPQSTVAETC